MPRYRNKRSYARFRDTGHCAAMSGQSCFFARYPRARAAIRLTFCLIGSLFAPRRGLPAVCRDESRFSPSYSLNAENTIEYEKDVIRRYDMRRDDDRRGICERAGSCRVFRNKTVRTRTDCLRRAAVCVYGSAPRRGSENERQSARRQPHDVRQGSGSRRRDNHRKRGHSAFRDDGGYGQSNDRYNRRGTAVRRCAVSYRHIRDAYGRTRTCESQRRHGAVYCRDACRGVPLLPSGPVRVSVGVGNSAVVRLCFHESAARCGRACRQTRNERRTDTCGKRNERGYNCRAACSDMRRAAAGSGVGNAAYVAGAVLASRIRALFGMPAVLHIHDRDRSAFDRA